MKKNIRTYVLQEPHHISSTIMYIKNELIETLSSDQSMSNLMDTVSQLTDVFFIFPKELTKTINPKRFSSLYNATGYSITELSEVESVMKVYEYFYVVFEKKHINSFYLNDPNYLKEVDIADSIYRLQLANLNRCVFNDERINTQNLREIYLERPKTLYQKIFGIPEIEEMNGMYCSHTTPDRMLFLKVLTIKKVLDYIKADKLYFETFFNYSFETFISSVLHKIGINETLINATIDDVLKV